MKLSIISQLGNKKDKLKFCLKAVKQEQKFKEGKFDFFFLTKLC